jgi:hypothetical protein
MTARISNLSFFMPASVETGADSPNRGILLSVLSAETVNSMEPVVYKWFMELNVEAYHIVQFAKLYAEMSPNVFRKEFATHPGWYPL